ncbi:Methyltransferase domain-containing protein [Actinacidiphila rubida]|uniref:Methyltransferase domain-containing protein n=1 Tax=Actinacidiphila rubida TaxID=310780 RepID=A0A1H8KK66_9ACTN|nr:class I SAM-dependent methyltransferase [Actinacidiphila rubida]SEN93349.1 Methyltransferase domain-containing protein [Actinacidiphila rubida]
MSHPLPHSAHDGAPAHDRPASHDPDAAPHQPGPGNGHSPTHSHSGEGHRHGHGSDDHAAHGGAHDDDHAELLDLDAEVFAEQLSSLTAWLPVDGAPRRVVDLGCGTGAGTLALLARFPDAEVTAVDFSPAHLNRLREKAAERGVAGRVRTVRADLDAGWPDLGRPDLVWASASLHHMADPDRTLQRIRDVLASGGLLAVVELAGFPRFLPADAPRDAPGLEDRAHALSDRRHAEQLRHRGADWGAKLSTAGFTLAAERTLAVRLDRAGLDPARSETLGRYALSALRRLHGAVADDLSASDLAALDRLLDTAAPDGVLHRGDLTMRTERTAWAARP